MKVLENMEKACILKELDDIAALVVAAKGGHDEVVQTVINAMLEELPMQKVSHNWPDISSTRLASCAGGYVFDSHNNIHIHIHGVALQLYRCSTTRHTSTSNISFVGITTVTMRAVPLSLAA